MRRLDKALLVLAIATVLLAAGRFSSGSSATAVAALKQQLSTLATAWEALRAESDMRYQTIHTWVPESGVRGRYAIAATQLGLPLLEQIIGAPLFVSGPHGERLNFDNPNRFGHYNPAFLERLYATLETLYSDPTFREQFQPFYDQQLQRYLRTCYMAYDIAIADSTIVAAYQQQLSGPEAADAGYLLQEHFRPFAESLQEDGYDFYEAASCPGFWVRRNIDGTADHFYQLLELTLFHFDP